MTHEESAFDSEGKADAAMGTAWLARWTFFVIVGPKVHVRLLQTKVDHCHLSPAPAPASARPTPAPEHESGVWFMGRTGRYKPSKRSGSTPVK